MDLRPASAKAVRDHPSVIASRWRLGSDRVIHHLASGPVVGPNVRLSDVFLVRLAAPVGRQKVDQGVQVGLLVVVDRRVAARRAKEVCVPRRKALAMTSMWSVSIVSCWAPMTSVGTLR